MASWLPIRARSLCTREQLALDATEADAITTANISNRLRIFEGTRKIDARLLGSNASYWGERQPLPLSLSKPRVLSQRARSDDDGDMPCPQGCRCHPSPKPEVPHEHASRHAIAPT